MTSTPNAGEASKLPSSISMGGIPSRPGALLGKLLSEPLTRSQRAEALRILAEVALVEEDPRLQTISSCKRCPSRTTRSAQTRSNSCSPTSPARLVRLRPHSRVCAPGRRAPRRLRGWAVAGRSSFSYRAIADFIAGQRGRLEVRGTRARARGSGSHDVARSRPDRYIAGFLRMFVGHHAEARDLMTATCSRLAQRGEEKDLATALIWRSWLEMRCGSFENGRENRRRVDRVRLDVREPDHGNVGDEQCARSPTLISVTSATSAGDAPMLLAGEGGQSARYAPLGDE